MVDTVTYGNFKTDKKLKEKRQIILCHTSREIGEYLISLKFRNSGKYDKLPHYVLTRDGRLLEILSPNYSSNYLIDKDIKKQQIIVCLENLGWMNKKPLSDTFLNWIGNIYKDKVYEKKWRDYFLWQPYTDIQIDKTVELCKELCEKFSIQNKFVGHNTKIDGIENFKGIVSRSNFNSRFTDLSPAFPFETFKTKIENE
jgi:N-acetyl-anhydromuramyl-L-alanine amidase AmpD